MLPRTVVRVELFSIADLVLIRKQMILLPKVVMTRAFGQHRVPRSFLENVNPYCISGNKTEEMFLCTLTEKAAKQSEEGLFTLLGLATNETKKRIRNIKKSSSLPNKQKLTKIKSDFII